MQTYKERVREWGRSSITWFTLQMASQAGAKLNQYEARNKEFLPSLPSAWFQGLRSSSTAFTGYRQGAGSEAEQSGLVMVPT